MSSIAETRAEIARTLEQLRALTKSAFQPMPGDASPPASGPVPGAGAPPAPPAGPAGPAAGAPPPMPAPPAAPEMPAMPPAADPSAMVPAAPAQGVDPQVLMEILTALEKVTLALQQMDKRVDRVEHIAHESATKYAECNGKLSQMLDLLGQEPPPAAVQSAAPAAPAAAPMA